MPNGLWYARGPQRFHQAIPVSAFSKGDLLMFDSNSSFSRVNVLLASGVDIAGVAMADSVDSISNLVTAIVPNPDTEFWCSLATNLTSVTTPGVSGDILFAVANNRCYLDPSSTNSARAVVVLGTNEVDQSVQSRVLVRILRVTDANQLTDF